MGVDPQCCQIPIVVPTNKLWQFRSEIADQHVDDLVKYVSLLGVGARRDYNNQTGESHSSQLAVPDVTDHQL